MIVTRYRRITAALIVLSITYVVLSVLLPVDKAALAKYHMTAGQDRGLTFTITLPYLAIWFIALVGYLRLKSYSDAIQRSKDGSAFRTISLGMSLLAFWLPLSTLLGTITRAYYQAHTSAKPEMVILNNYLNIVFLLGAFWLLHVGTRQLLDVIKKPAPRLPQTMMMAFIAFSSLYLFLVLQDPARQFVSHHVAVAAYYLPDWLIVLTVVIPRLIFWHLGMQAVYNLYLYRKTVKGAIYKKGLNDFASGIAWVVIIIVALGCFESLSVQLTTWTLGLILGFVYILLVLLGVGYILIARGAKNLQRIEEI